MRVDYTLPALQPGSLPEMTQGQETARSFRDQLRSMAVQLPVSWEQQLQLDAPPFSASYVGPPPRPQTLELKDPEAERARWRNMLRRHSATLAASGGSNGSQSVQAMLEMLSQMQQMEDAIVSRNVAVTRG